MKVTAEFDEQDLPWLKELLRREELAPGHPGGGSFKFDYERTKAILVNVIARLEGGVGTQIAEPPVGSMVRDCEGDFWTHEADGWRLGRGLANLFGTPHPRTWEQINDQHGPLTRWPEQQED